MNFDYYYGDESEQYSYFRIPRLLVTGDQFKGLSTDAKLLYGLLLDRMGLSAKNGWYDQLGRVYIFYPLQEIQEDMNCGHDKATKLLMELAQIDLIERVRQGQGKPAKIYAKRFTVGRSPPQPSMPQDFPAPSSPDCGKAAVKSAENPQPRLRQSRSPECGKPAGIYQEINQTENSPLYSSIHPSPPMDRSDCKKRVWLQIDAENLSLRHGREIVDEVAELMTDTYCTTSPTLRIGRDEVPASQVIDRLRRLTSEHLDYVFECMGRNTSQIRNIRAYLLTALYNAPATINSYYQAEVRHDFG